MRRAARAGSRTGMHVVMVDWRNWLCTLAVSLCLTARPTYRGSVPGMSAATSDGDSCPTEMDLKRDTARKSQET